MTARCSATRWGGGTIRNDEALTAGFGALPSGHDGETAFTVGLAFSEEVAVNAAALAAALDVTGGSVTGRACARCREHEELGDRRRAVGGPGT